jgi:hypothetical protein
MKLPRRSGRYWLSLGLALLLGSLAILIAFDLIHVGDDVLDDRVPGYVFVILAITFWSGILILFALVLPLCLRLLRHGVPEQDSN